MKPLNSFEAHNPKDYVLGFIKTELAKNLVNIHDVKMIHESLGIVQGM
ncbi:MAG: hypothetical protein HUJ51_01815 [Eggerthellaceae bacterium]|nr:hypothetical protein [Eggerthellaceae bacterium]